MTLRLFSQVNADSDLIEAWLKYYLRLGVDCFHLVVHGRPEENEKLFAIKDSYPITIEDIYQGPFPAPISVDGKANSTEKKQRLDSLLACHTGQWVLLADSDEFVEFPYQDIPETIRQLESANANLMAAPMLQRLKSDGSLDSPAIIEDPFKIFPLCSADLYRRMGVKAEIFKFPLFYCERGTELVEEGNHYPPLGLEPRSAGMVGVTHHFKFRRCLAARLEKRINSAHLWRNDSLGFREYLDSHSNRLPLEGAFFYSREELFKRRLLRQLPVPKSGCRESHAQRIAEDRENPLATSASETRAPSRNGKPRALPRVNGKKIAFVLPKASEFGGLERHLLDLLRRLPELPPPTVICFGQDIITARMDQDQQGQVVVKCIEEPQSLWDWLRIIRKNKPDIVVFPYSWIEAFPWQAPVAARLAGIRRRISVQHLIPPPLPSPIQVKSPRDLLRRLIGRRSRDLLKVKISARLCGYLSSTTVCVSNAVRDALVNMYGFRPRKTVVIFNGVSSSTFSPSETNGAAVRAQLYIDPEEFLLVCAARLVAAKGIDILIRAVSQVVRQGVPCKCIILGDGPLREELQQKVNFEGLWDHVLFEGFQQDVRSYLQAASAFILTSYLEGLPISILEAMACGLPCIVTNVGGSAEAVQNGVTGLIIPPGSVEAAADAILYLATNPDKRAEMARKAREVAAQSFDIEDRMGELRRVILAP
jgi:glycosyltransferase involved in cell wall biosynthesis